MPPKHPSRTPLQIYEAERRAGEPRHRIIANALEEMQSVPDGDVQMKAFLLAFHTLWGAQMQKASACGSSATPAHKKEVCNVCSGEFREMNRGSHEASKQHQAALGKNKAEQVLHPVSTARPAAPATQHKQPSAKGVGFDCTVCKQHFVTTAELKRHMKTATGAGHKRWRDAQRDEKDRAEEQREAQGVYEEWYGADMGNTGYCGGD